MGAPSRPPHRIASSAKPETRWIRYSKTPCLELDITTQPTSPVYHTDMESIQKENSFRHQKYGIALATAGFACLYTVAIVFFYCDWLFELPEADPLRYGLALNGSLCLTSIAVFLVSRNGSLPTAPAIATGTVGYLFALALMATSSIYNSLEIAYAASVAAGIGAGILVPLWFDRAALLADDKFAYVIGFGSLASAPVALMLDELPTPTLGIACGILIAVSVVLLKSLDRRDSAPESSESDPSSNAQNASRALAAPLVYVMMLSFAYGMLDSVAMANPFVTAASSGFASQVGGIASNIAFILYVRFDGKRYATLLNVALAAVATGLLFLPFLSGTYSVALVVLTHMGWEMALLVSYALVIEVFRSRSTQLVAWAALVFAAPRPGVLLGSLAASAVAVNDQFAFAQMTIIAFALLYLILLGVWLLKTREKRAADRAIRKRDDLIKRYLRARDDLQNLSCEELAQKHRLTKRETEILKLLAQGRDAAYIERTLFLSRNTVKSYTKSLYAKLGVHSKQAVIDLVKENVPWHDELS